MDNVSETRTIRCHGMFREPSSDSEKTTNQSPWMGNGAQAQIQPQFPEQQIIVILSLIHI